MPTVERRPKAVEPLLTADHSKRGRRFVTVLDTQRNRVTLLEPWEHAVLVLCDGTRDAEEIAELLIAGVEGEAVTERSVVRCLKYFERQEIIEQVGYRREGAMKPAGPRTLAGIQLAYREWHKDPVKTGQILAGQLAPFPMVDGHIQVGLAPTVALPEDEEGGESRKPVAIGTTLVLGSSEQSFEDGQQLRSVFDTPSEPPPASEASDRSREPETQIGSLAGGDEAAGDPSDDDLEFGNVAELLKMVDDDLNEQEEASSKKKPVVPPVGKAIGGIAEVPAAKTRELPIQQATAELMSSVPVEPPVERTERARRSQLHRAVAPEKALNPTMVGLPPADGDEEPVIISPPRRSSSRVGAGERVGAVIGPVPSDVRPNVEPSSATQKSSGIEQGALVEDTQTIETPTEGAYAAMSPEAFSPRRERTGATIGRSPEVATRVDEESTTSSTSEHIHRRARAVFERLRRLGLKARTYGDESWDGETDVVAHAKKRRKHEAESREFEQALETLTAGDLEVALSHFRNLRAKLPDSERVAKFVEAIEAAHPDRESDGGETTRRILYSFEQAIEGAMAAGRCPQCFTKLDIDEMRCFSCGFEA